MNPTDLPTPSPEHESSVPPDSPLPETIRIPRIEEQLLVSTQWVETGRVTLAKTVQVQEQLVTVPLRSEQYIVERTKLDQFVEEIPSPRQEGETTIYPVVEEVLVIQKRLRLVEEIRVTKQQVSSTHQETVVLRREAVTVERTNFPLSPERTDLTDESTTSVPLPTSDQPGESSL